jgi:hypothetical protein
MADQEHTGMAGWAAFAGFMLILVGAFDLLYGIAALFHKASLPGSADSLVIVQNLAAWGWWQLIVGAILILSGLLILSGNALGRTVGVIVAMLNAIAQMTLINLHPVWGFMIIVVDVVVIYALIVYGGELRGMGG